MSTFLLHETYTETNYGTMHKLHSFELIYHILLLMQILGLSVIFVCVGIKRKLLKGTYLPGVLNFQTFQICALANTMVKSRRDIILMEKKSM